MDTVTRYTLGRNTASKIDFFKLLKEALILCSIFQVVSWELDYSLVQSNTNGWYRAVFVMC